MIATDQSFSEIIVALDGGTFRRCKFDRCRMVYSAALPVNFKGCHFHDCTWEFSGAALATLHFMTIMYHGGMKNVIEQIFDGIRNQKPTGTAQPATIRMN